MNSERPRILSGARASSPRIHIGNYEGAVKPWIDLQDDHEMYCMIADYHGLTTLGATPPDLGYWSRECAKDFVACGLDPEKCAIFIQSRVPQHAELHLILSMFTGLGKLERVPTFKEKKDNLGAEQQVSYGLLGYPVLQAADILLYRPFGVPVGKDQAAHLELSREIGRSFNSAYGVEYFPEFYTIISTDESRSTLPGLDMRKMSKSYDNCIYINETADETAKKIMSAYTTPSKRALSDPGIPEGCAVCQYLRLYSPSWESQWEEDRQGQRGCVQNKRELIECLNEFLRPMRERRAQIDDAEIERILADGTERAIAFASQTIREVKQIMRLA